MKDLIKRKIIANPFLVSLMFQYFKLKNGSAYFAECERRKKLSFFDIKELSQELPYGPEERVIDNNLYGHAHYLKKYAGINHDLNAYLEHGLFWGGMVHADQKHWYTNRVITFSKIRKQAIEHKLPGQQAICVGPYIHYASSLYDDKRMQQLKKELGRVLLVFPSHSIVNQTREFSLEDFITEINRIKEGFDTVLISLYYLDALNAEQVKFYEDQGFRIVCSGHRYDRHFISRQRTILELADVTISNSVGTHVGYCTHLNKPHYIFKQKSSMRSTSEKEVQRHESMYDGNEKEVSEMQKNEVAEAFSTYRPNEISNEQKEVVEKFWGTSEVKTPQELRAIFGA